jgi:hypothetical protein
MKITWKPARGRHATGEELWIGKRCVGCYFQAVVPKGSPTIYRASIGLPSISIKPEFVDHRMPAQAKAVVERMVEIWFRSLEEE